MKQNKPQPELSSNCPAQQARQEEPFMFIQRKTEV